MEYRFKFRIPFYKYDNTFAEFEYTDFIKGLGAYNAGVVYRKEFEQCTGLKDKNGKLIYEGDLVKLPVNCNKELHGVYTTREVVWRNGFWVLSYVSSQKGQIMPRGYSAGFLHDYLDDDFNEYFLFGNNDMFCKYKQLEVIGNIHENLELLEVKDESQASKENL